MVAHGHVSRLVFLSVSTACKISVACESHCKSASM